jgi:hypothetical protein
MEIDLAEDLLQQSPNCTYREIKGLSKFWVVMSLLGISLIPDGIFLGLYFAGEQLHVAPVLNLTLLPNLSLGDNIAIFFIFVMSASFIGIVLLWIIYRHYQKKQCKKIIA